MPTVVTSHDEARLAASYQKSSYIESVLRHRMLAEMASELWQRSPEFTLQVFNSEVDDAGFDLVLSVGTAVRYVQLKQARFDKTKPSCSIRLPFSRLIGSAAVLMAYRCDNLEIESYGFFGNGPHSCMDEIENYKVSRSPVKKDSSGKKQQRPNYRDVPTCAFKRRLDMGALVDLLFPATRTSHT